MGVGYRGLRAGVSWNEHGEGGDVDERPEAR